MKPKDVNKENERQLLETVYMITLTNKKPKFEVGDRIRLSKNAYIMFGFILFLILTAKKLKREYTKKKCN
jgi:hypothetical protein